MCDSCNEWFCLTCRDTGQVWSQDYDGSLYDQACPDCDTPYPSPQDKTEAAASDAAELAAQRAAMEVW